MLSFLHVTCIQNQIIHKHVHVDYNPLKGMLVLKIVNCPLCSWSWKSRSLADSMAIYQCQTANQVFIFCWILNFMDQPTRKNNENWYPTNKNDFTVLSICYLSKIHDLGQTHKNVAGLHMFCESTTPPKKARETERE